jgi:hypothetical protein
VGGEQSGQAVGDALLGHGVFTGISFSEDAMSMDTPFHWSKALAEFQCAKAESFRRSRVLTIKQSGYLRSVDTSCTVCLKFRQWPPISAFSVIFGFSGSKIARFQKLYDSLFD